uniref:Formin-like protein 20 isoform X1 n=1 Tax=Rhizophora mucronata TaxID=61149 RepID=A0A2P2KGN4_RHIMU
MGSKPLICNTAERITILTPQKSTTTADPAILQDQDFTEYPPINA